MKSARGVFFLLVVCLLPAAAANAGSFVFPGSSSATEGSSNNAFPFNIGPSMDSQRYQQVFAASEFPGAIVIDALVFRPDAEFGAAFSSTLSDVRIDLSTTSKAPGALSTTFANNVGADDTIVRTGALTLSSSFTGPANGPKDFDIVITLSTPFFYNPALGNLLLDVRNFGGGRTTQFDALDSSSLMSRVWSSTTNGVNDPTGLVFGDEGLVTEFQFHTTTVPEPATLVLLGAGLTGLAVRLRGRRG